MRARVHQALMALLDRYERWRYRRLHDQLRNAMIARRTRARRR